MREFNDCVNLTVKYLQSYNQLIVAKQNLEQIVKDMGQEQVAPPIARYGENPGGGTPELNTVEAATSRIISNAKREDSIRQDISRIASLLGRLDRSISTLEPEERNLVEGAYILGKTWRAISTENYISEKWAREKTRGAVKKIARMFGIGGVPLDGGNFIFIR